MKKIKSVHIRVGVVVVVVVVVEVVEVVVVVEVVKVVKVVKVVEVVIVAAVVISETQKGEGQRSFRKSLKIHSPHFCRKNTNSFCNDSFLSWV